MAVMDQLVADHRLAQGINPVPWSAEEACDSSHPGRGDDWADWVVQLAAFAHVRVSWSCRGYTTWSSGRAGCGCCGWGMSARTGDVGTPGSARFAQAALARVGQAIALAVDEIAQALFQAVLPWA